MSGKEVGVVNLYKYYFYPHHYHHVEFDLAETMVDIVHRLQNNLFILSFE